METVTKFCRHAPDDVFSEEEEEEGVTNMDVSDIHDETNAMDLDIAFIVDCTGSMGASIQAAKDSIVHIFNTLQESCQNGGSVRFALVCYRDHPPQDSSYAVKVFGFTESVAAAKRNVLTMEANGGGDGPESMTDGVVEAIRLDWRRNANTTRVCILIADAPPHGVGEPGDGFASGCPCGEDLIAAVHRMCENNIILHTVGTAGIQNFTRVLLRGLAFAAGGRYSSLQNAPQLGKLVIGSAREEMELEALKERIDAECLSVFNEYLREKRRWLDCPMVFEEVLRRLQKAGVRCHSVRQSGGTTTHAMEGIFDKIVAASRDMAQLLQAMTAIRGHRYGPVPPATHGGDYVEYDDLLSMDQLTRLMYRFGESRFIKAFAESLKKQ